MELNLEIRVAANEDDLGAQAFLLNLGGSNERPYSACSCPYRLQGRNRRSSRSECRHDGSGELKWATENSMMTCRREELQLFDPTEGLNLIAGGDPAAPLNPNLADSMQCARTGIAGSFQMGQKRIAMQHGEVWRVGCPAPIVDLISGKIVGYKLPECPHRDVAICEVDLGYLKSGSSRIARPGPISVSKIPMNHERSTRG